VIVAIVHNILITLNYYLHASMIAGNSNSVKENYASQYTPAPKQGTALISPALEGAGFYAPI
jgi:hypothetical protein